MKLPRPTSTLLRAALLGGAALLVAPLLAPTPLLAGPQDPWAGDWRFELAGAKHGSTPMKVRRVAVVQGGERLLARGPGRKGWSLQIEIAAAKVVGLVQITATRQDRRMVCAGVVDRGVMSGTCYDGRGEARTFRLLPAQAVAEEQPAQPVVVAQPVPQPPAPQSPPAVVVVQQPPAPPAPAVPSCTETLLAKGHHPMHLKKCKGAEPFCAEALLNKGHHPMHLSNCTYDVEPQCARALLERGHHPTHLRQCRGVNPQCAVSVIAKGHHPVHLSNCR
ncbi:MAG: hypothetical protein RIT45_4344 [Pseudomonadota bacterium]|jgi:hypothetical protein